MDNKLISVIIPCYNVEKYVGKCMESVLSQTYNNIEVIAVDDGSTDGTSTILEKYSADNRVKIIKQRNLGVSAARNAGIEAASGKFIAFVDSDDFLELEMYEQLCLALEEQDADMAVCNYNLVYDDHADRKYSKIDNEAVNIYEDVYGYFCKYCACPKPNNYIWTRLYRTDIIKKSNVCFENYKLGDDTLFNFKLLPHIKRVAFVDSGLYNYYQRANSNVYTIANKNNLAIVYADTFDALADYYEENYKAFVSVLPIHAFSRLRSVFFYSRLAGMHEEDIVKNVVAGFKGRKISQYLTGAEK